MGRGSAEFWARRGADEVSFGPVVRVVLSALVVVPLWWVVDAAISMAMLSPKPGAIFRGVAGVVLLCRVPQYLGDLWRPTHRARKVAMRERAEANRIAQEVAAPPRASIMEPPCAPPRRW